VCNAPSLILRYFSPSLPILSFPSCKKVRNCDIEAIFEEQDIRSTIGTILSLIKKSQEDIQTKNNIPQGKKSMMFEVKLNIIGSFNEI
jgi:hypothetical protein